VDDNSMEYRKQMELVLLRRVATDPAFRAQLLAEPRKAVELVLGSPLPPAISVRVIEEKPTELVVVVPAALSNAELVDADLEAVAGGAAKPPRFDSSRTNAVAGVRG
jgi:hypothetical protein